MKNFSASGQDPENRTQSLGGPLRCLDCMRVWAILLILIGFAVSEQSLSAPPLRPSAKEACADDFWKWCSQNEAPFDCFKRRGFFKKESPLTPECRRAWARPKSESELAAQSAPAPVAQPRELRAQEIKPSTPVPPPAPAAPAEAPREARQPSSEPMTSNVPKPDIVDDFSELNFD